ncbi:MAG: CocE/NonD family hydrolase C-terminal non-catalytic domain-containing protein, partial [Oceanicaulis sp.]
HIGHNIPKGHRIRVSVSTVYWPLAWTPPEPTKLTIQTGVSKLRLPVRTEDARASGDSGREFGPPVGAPGPATTQIEPPENTWKVHRDLASKYSELEVVDSRGTFRLDDIDLTVSAKAREVYSAVTGDFTSVREHTEWIRTLERGEWSVMTRTTTTLTSDEKNFYITAELDAYAGDVRFACKSWNETIRRDLV